MEKYDFIICMNLHKKLKERIKGNIFINIKDKSIEININPGRGIVYKSFIDILPRKEQINEYVDSIEKDYRDFINEKYFII